MRARRYAPPAHRAAPGGGEDAPEDGGASRPARPARARDAEDTGPAAGRWRRRHVFGGLDPSERADVAAAPGDRTTQARAAGAPVRCRRGPAFRASWAKEGRNEHHGAKKGGGVAAARGAAASPAATVGSTGPPFLAGRARLVYGAARDASLLDH